MLSGRAPALTAETAAALFWKEQYQTRCPLAATGHLDVERYRLHQRMQNWQGQLANVLACVADRKFPRCGDLAADGFQAVLARLEDAFRHAGP